MADTKISALSAAAALVGTEPLAIVQGAATVKATVQAVADLISFVPNPQTGTTYTVAGGDRKKLVTFTNAAPIAVTLPVASATFPNGWFAYFQNRGVGTVTITPTTSTIDGAAALALATNQGALVVSDGSNYFTMRGFGGGAATPINAQTASYTLVLGDVGYCVEISNASANNLTVPPNSSVAFPLGTTILVRQMGAGLMTVVAGSGVTIRSPASLVLRGQYATANLHKRGTNEWCLDGNIT